MQRPGLYFKYILRKRVVTNIYRIANLKRHSLVVCSKLNDINNAHQWILHVDMEQRWTTKKYRLSSYLSILFQITGTWKLSCPYKKLNTLVVRSFKCSKFRNKNCIEIEKNCWSDIYMDVAKTAANIYIWSKSLLGFFCIFNIVNWRQNIYSSILCYSICSTLCVLYGNGSSK